MQVYPVPEDYTPFSEDEYLRLNLDVAEAVKAGQFSSGWDHYSRAGFLENRQCHGLTRISKVLSTIDADGLGLEIGPSHNPVAPKRLGFNVHILDHLDTDSLRKKYTDHGVNIDNIENVDFVWKGDSLVDLVGTPDTYDWIIASHVVEHLPDLISFFQQCEALLKQDGRLALIVPDKRYCFDHFNSISRTGSFLDAFHNKNVRPTPGQVFDYLSNAAKLDESIAWSRSTEGELGLLHSFKQAQDVWEAVRAGTDYFDAHCWRFTPDSFRLLISDLNALGLIKMSIISEYDTEGCEFFATLSKSDGRSATTPRLDVLSKLLMQT